MNDAAQHKMTHLPALVLHSDQQDKQASRHTAAAATMALAQFRRLNSTDHGVPVTRLRDALRHEWANAQYNTDPEDTLHDKDVEHGGPDAYLDHLKAHVAEHGVREPVKVGPSPPDGPGLHLLDGNHRAVVIHELGIDPVPVHFTGGTHTAASGMTVEEEVE